MHIRLDTDNARAVRKEAQWHRRFFKRRRSFADVANEMIRRVVENPAWHPAKNMGNLGWVEKKKP